MNRKDELTKEIDELKSELEMIESMPPKIEISVGDIGFSMVELDGFAIGETPVTQELWVEIMGANPSHFDYGYDYPVETVSYADILAFLRKLNERFPDRNFRLPTSEEWELAARAGTTTTYWWGNDPDPKCATYDVNGTTPVYSNKPNPFGLYDMLGNVWEFTSTPWK